MAAAASPIRCPDPADAGILLHSHLILTPHLHARQLDIGLED